jgi:hypothetical protein
MTNDDQLAQHALPEWDDWAQGVYVVEVARQCVFGIRAAYDLGLAINATGVGWSAWYAAQNFLTATANVSRLFRPSRPVKKKDPSGDPDRQKRQAHRGRLAEQWGKKTSARGFAPCSM